MFTRWSLTKTISKIHQLKRKKQTTKRKIRNRCFLSSVKLWYLSFDFLLMFINPNKKLLRYSLFFLLHREDFPNFTAQGVCLVNSCWIQINYHFNPLFKIKLARTCKANEGSLMKTGEQLRCTEIFDPWDSNVMERKDEKEEGYRCGLFCGRLSGDHYNLILFSVNE